MSQFLNDPLAELAPAPEPNEEIEDLKSQLRSNQMQLTSVIERYIQREKELRMQIESLQE